jgi:hypothetical protein
MPPLERVLKPPPRKTTAAPAKKPAAAATKRAMVGGPSDVEMAKAGDMGIFFRFGGLATLTHAGNQRPVGATAVTHIGAKWVFSERWMMPIYAGSGLLVRKPDGVGSSTDFGIEAGAGLEYHFRIWRHISPYIGATVGLFYVNPSGTDLWAFGFGLGPNLGVEYFFSDRLSFQALYTFVVAMSFQKVPANGQFAFGVTTSAGGALNLTYYF